MKERYKITNFHKKSMERLDQIESIVNEYQNAGYKLTVRQIYYQLVSRDLIPNNAKEYIKIVNLVKNGRYNAILDWDMVVDRNRQVKQLSHWESPEQIIETAAESYHIDLWADQKIYCEVWTEKNALIDIIWQAAKPYDVSCFACIGYNSATAMKDAADRFNVKFGQGKKCILYYIGDHDPSGKNMTVDIQKRFEEFGADVDVQRIALNMDQVKKYKLPPNPVKIDPETKKYKDSRAKKYVEEFGNYSWEVDALPPEKLSELITESVIFNLDIKLFEKSIKKQKREKIKIMGLMNFL